MLTEKDKALVERARRTRWEDIDEGEAETEEGRRALHRVIMGKYHLDELFSGML